MNNVEKGHGSPEASAPVTSLWACLHDAELLAIRSDRHQRTVALEMAVSYLREHFHLPEDLLFLVRLDEVKGVYACEHVPWPGGIELAPSASLEEQEQAAAEWQVRGREESLGWGAFEGAVGQEGFEVSDAGLVSSESGLSLCLQGQVLATEQWCRVRVDGAALSVQRSDGEPFSLDELLAMGDAYWEAFSGRRRQIADGGIHGYPAAPDTNDRR
jgi:hypothetical protein